MGDQGLPGPPGPQGLTGQPGIPGIDYAQERPSFFLKGIKLELLKVLGGKSNDFLKREVSKAVGKHPLPPPLDILSTPLTIVYAGYMAFANI